MGMPALAVGRPLMPCPAKSARAGTHPHVARVRHRTCGSPSPRRGCGAILLPMLKQAKPVRRCPWRPVVPVLLVMALQTACSVAHCEEPPGKKPAYPLWDGQESVAEYAQRVNLPPTQTLDLGNGVKLELVLIPAGKFVMGTPEPETPT